MKLSFIFLTFLFYQSTQAQEAHIRPPSFNTSSGRVTFVHFTKVSYALEYNANTNKAFARSVIQFHSDEVGRPAFDLVPNPTLIVLDGQISSQELISTPQAATQIRAVKDTVSIGDHTLIVENDLDGLRDDAQGKYVEKLFRLDDSTDRSYLEKYLPSNLEFDQVDMSLQIKILSATVQQQVITNGDIDLPPSTRELLNSDLVLTC